MNITIEMVPHPPLRQIDLTEQSRLMVNSLYINVL